MIEKEDLPSCPFCDGQDLWRRGKTANGLQRWYCKSCGRQFHIDLHREMMLDIVTSLLRQKVDVMKIARALRGQVGKSTLYRMKGSKNHG